MPRESQVRLRRAPLLLSLATATACGAARTSPELPPESPKPLAVPTAAAGASAVAEESPALPWAQATYSPQPGSAFEPELDALLAGCGRGDVALHEVAEWVATAHQGGGAPPSLDEVTFHLRRRGSPYVMPRLWTATMSGVPEDELVELVTDWGTGKRALGELRCGVGVSIGDDGAQTVSVLQVDVLAELRPLPTSAEPGARVDLAAVLLVPATAASVVLLPPDGAPRTLAVEIEGGVARARFSVPTEGTWLAQVMATMEGGPRPVAAALVAVGQAPPSAVDGRPVPGEDASSPDAPPSDALFAMLNGARAKQGLPALRRSSQLDRVAAEHSKAMRAAGRIGHDTGRGDPARRVEMAGLSPKATGENVAMAQSAARLHRVLWASPSHRENLLLRRWDHAGVAVAPAEDGTLYATQLFTDEE
jgi:uncharacterized protein YkwD